MNSPHTTLTHKTTHNVAFKKHPISTWLFIIACAFIIAVFTHKSLGQPLTTGIDASWGFALNYFHDHHIILGQHAFFTYGPLGYLLYPLPMGNHLWYAGLFWFALRWLLATCMIQLALSTNDKETYSYYLLLALVGLFFFAIANVYLLLFLTTTFILLFNLNKQSTYYLLCAAAICVLTFLIKPGQALYNLIALYSYLIIYSVWARNYRRLLEVSAALVVLYVLLWLAVNHTLAGAWEFLPSTWQFMRGYDAAMSLEKPIHWVYLLGSVGAFLLSIIPFLKRPCMAKNGAIVFLLFVVPMLLCYKYSYNRLNEHVYTMMIVLLMLYSYLLLWVGSLPRFIILLLFGAASLGLQGLSQAYMGYDYTILSTNMVLPRYFGEQIIHARSHYNQLRTRSQHNINDLTLPPNILDKTFDIYPYNLSIVAIKHLAWQPRPVIQSYTSYTPALDNLNAVFFQRGQGADYILWHQADNLIEIDTRYLPNSEPNTVFALFNYYRPVWSEGAYALLKKQAAAQLSTPQRLLTTQTHWDTWTTVPSLSSDVLRAAIHAQATFWQQIKRMLFKQQSVWIDYRFDNGAVETYRLILATAENGIWIRPVIHALSNHPQAVILQVNTAPTAAEYGLDDAHIVNGFITAAGWAFLKHAPITGQSTAVVLSSPHVTYRIATKFAMRADKRRQFATLDLNPEYLGFTARINLSGMPPDVYQLHILITNGTRVMLSPPLASFTITPAQQQRSNIVTAFRLRHHPEDSFKDIIRIDWLGADFLTKDHWLKNN